MNYVALGDLVTFQAGYQKKGQMTNDPSGTVKCIRLNDLDFDKRSINHANVWQIKPEKGLEKYLVNKDDVLYLSRGSSFGAYRVGDVPSKTIALFHFAILRPIPKAPILSDYLWWVLNEPRVMDIVESVMRGTAIKFVGVQDLSKILIPVPEQSIQEAITKIATHRLREKELVLLIEDTKDRLCKAVLRRLADGIGNMSGGV